MPKPPKRPIDAMDTPNAADLGGKDALDKAAETLWEAMRSGMLVWDCLHDEAEGPYHVQPGHVRKHVQYAVLSLMGTAVPALLRQRAREAHANGAKRSETADLRDLADDLEESFG